MSYFKWTLDGLLQANNQIVFMATRIQTEYQHNFDTISSLSDSMTPITFTIDETFVVAKDIKKGWIFDANPNLDN